MVDYNSITDPSAVVLALLDTMEDFDAVKQKLREMDENYEEYLSEKAAAPKQRTKQTSDERNAKRRAARAAKKAVGGGGA